MDWFDLLGVQGTLKNLLQHHSSKALILRHSAFFIVQLLHPYMTTGKTTALMRRTFVVNVQLSPNETCALTPSRLCIYCSFCVEDSSGLPNYAFFGIQLSYHLLHPLHTWVEVISLLCLLQGIIVCLSICPCTQNNLRIGLWSEMKACIWDTKFCILFQHSLQHSSSASRIMKKTNERKASAYFPEGHRKITGGSRSPRSTNHLEL